MIDTKTVRGSHVLLFWALPIVILCALLAACLTREGLELVIRPIEGGDVLFRAHLEPGERFTLHYMHSVDQAPVWEEHSVDEQGNIYVEEERFVMLGAGMGHWEGHGTLTRRGRYDVIENIHERLGSFILRVGSENTGHTLLLRDMEVNLSSRAAGRAVLVSAAPVSLLESLWRHVSLSRTVIAE